jgi:hypothetical protein
MTSAPTGDYQPPAGNGGLGNSPNVENGTGSTTDAAKEQAAQVGQSAKESGTQVASTAADEAKNVTAEARKQAKDLTQEVGNQAQQQAAIGKDKAAGSLHSLGEELRSMARNSDQSGPVTDLAHEAADKVTDLATWIEQRDPGTLLEEVRSFARRKPGTFLVGAAAAGIVAGRLTRGAVRASKDDTTSDVSQRSSGGAQDAATNGSWTTSGAEATNGQLPASYAEEPTPIADVTAAETRLASGEPESASNGYESAGRQL